MRQKSSHGLRSFLICMVAVLTVVLFITGSAYATNGYFAHGYSIKNKALAGAGVALPLDSLAASANPAGMVFVGSRADVGVSLFNPNREYTVSGTPTTGTIMFPGVNCNAPGAPGVAGAPPCPLSLAPGTVESDSEWFVIPSLGYNRMLDDNSSVGLSIYGNGGMNTDYDTNTYHGSSPTGVDLIQLFIVPTYARKLNKKHAIGISPIFAYQSFEAQGLEAFGNENPMLSFSSDPSNLSNNGHESSYGYGVRVGYLGEVMPNLFLGVSYQSKVYMSELDKYAGLFAEQGDFDIPSNWTVGLAIKPSPEVTLTVDLQQINYGEIDSISNPFWPNLRNDQLGNDGGAGFGWEDIMILKMGAQWQSSPEWTWRAGFSVAEQVIPNTEVMFNIIAPGVIETHATCGVTKKIDDKQEIDFALMRAVSESVTGLNQLDPPNEQTQTGQMIELEMDQWEFSIGYTYKF
jgi:long-chain fatty acid transport protein